MIRQFAWTVAAAGGCGLLVGGFVAFWIGRWTRSEGAVFHDMKERIRDLEREGRAKDSTHAQDQMVIEDLKDQRRAMRSYAKHQALRMRQAADHMDELADMPGESSRTMKRRAS